MQKDELDPVAHTSRLTAAMRAAESRRPDALFTDPFAERLAGASARQLAEDFDGGPTIPVRTRYFDDAFAELRPSQIVVLAAGMDTRAFRLDFAPGTTLFELDRPAVLAHKERVIDAPARCERNTVGVDLATDWRDPLRAAGFQADRPTCWLVEGLTQYLEESAVLTLLDRLTELSAPGSTLLLDVVGRSVLEAHTMRATLDWMAEHGAPWLFGTEEPEALLTARGWDPEVSLFSTVGTRLGRWPYPDAPRGTPGVPHGYLIRATLR
ncbi:SAM-dependent methyltransferase [Sciscionella sediminilitoris]|uniref:SAM-dependent methyltransferase n=1 Tax=Sciscionella sediminilitoris TaxID=1445613 RepID=UPI0004DF0494|nr:SAM-dependent methyltransferase [Sciscionella sp. SE31]